jgi:23S rRNA maturation mini-RNase III
MKSTAASQSIQWLMQSPIGPLHLVASSKGLQGIFWKKKSVPMAKSLKDTSPEIKILAQTVSQLTEYFNGKLKKFNIPFDLGGTPFQKQVWQQLNQIPFGKTCAYKDIAIKIKNPKLLEQAFTHKSYSIEHGQVLNNERLEFLGDSVIASVVAHHLFLRFPDVDEGRLSKLKSQIVSRASLSDWAGDLDLGKYLFLSQGEEATGGRERESLLGNAYEAIVGALFLDQGYEAAERFILKHLSKKKRIVESTAKA